MPAIDQNRRLPRRIVLYDGECGFCDHSVQFLLQHDRHARLAFAPLGGDTAQAVRARHPRMPTDLDSLVLVEVDDTGREKVFWHSRAVLGIVRHLPQPWPLLRVFLVIPRFLRDLAYRGFARIRYRFFGRLDACRVPGPDERARFLP